MEVMLKAEGLSKSFNGSKGEQASILKDIDISIKKGEFVAIMGQSGSGKSTLLYNISGMDQCTAGRVIFDGEHISDMTDEVMSKTRLKKMGFVFQHSHLLKNMSIRDNVLLPAYKAALKSKAEAEKDVDELMEKLGILSVGAHDITKVSGGQLQRAALCRALINRPRMLFCDEPTGALNSSATREVMNILNQINQEGTTILLVTHDITVAARADRVIFLIDGRVATELELGKYKESSAENKLREERLMGWLNQHGF